MTTAQLRRSLPAACCILAAGASVALKLVQERPKPDAATFLGCGKVLALAEAYKQNAREIVEPTEHDIVGPSEQMRAAMDYYSNPTSAAPRTESRISNAIVGRIPIACPIWMST